LCIYLSGAYHAWIGYSDGVEMAAIDIATQVSWRDPGERPEASIIVLSTAELAECTCPEWCERDHDRD
jgi:hypothetical protein